MTLEPVIRSVRPPKGLGAIDGQRGGYLYRCYDANRGLLYIGSTANPPRIRMYVHRATKSWWPEVALVEYQYVVSLKAARTLERLAIRLEAPRHNVDHNDLVVPVGKRRLNRRSAS